MSKQEALPVVVLVADGEENVRKEMSSTLEKAGFTVLTAHSQSAVVDLCRRGSPGIQLAIVDATLPGTQGQDLVSCLRQSHPGIRVLLTSGPEDAAIVRGSLRKPFRRAQLLGRVLKALDDQMVATA